MPNQSVTLNGFKGGLNVDKDEADLSIAENAECREAKEVLLDEPGKIVSDRVTEAASTVYDTADVTQSITDTTLAIKDTKVYHKQGVYIVGDDVNYSFNSDYHGTKPLSGIAYQHDTTPLSATTYGFNLRCGYNQEKHLIIFLGKSASTNGTGKAIIMNGGGSSNADGHTLEGGGSYPEPQEYMRWSAYWDVDGDGRFLYNAADGDYEWWHLQTFDPGSVNDGRFRMQAFTDDTHNGESPWADIQTINTVYPIDISDVTCLGADKRATGVYGANDAVGVIWKVGLNDTVSAMGGQATMGYYGGGIDIANRDIFLECGTINVGVQNISIVLDSWENDNHWTMATFADPNQIGSYVRQYEIVLQEQQDSGMVGSADEPGKGRIRIPYASFKNSGTNFDPHKVTTIKVIYMPADTGSWGNTTPVGAPCFDLWELSFGPSRFSTVAGLVQQSSSGWLGNKYNLHSTQISEKGIESLPRTYMDQVVTSERFKFDATTFLGALFTVHKPATADWRGKLYYERLDNAGSGTGTLFEICEVSESEGLKKVGSDTFTAWEVATDHRSVAFDEPPTARTFRLNTGYPEGTTQIDCAWKHAAVVGRQAYIGNVKQPVSGAHSYDVDRILKAAPGHPAGFSNLEYIDLELGGAAITCMMSSADRLFIWTTSKLIILNVANDLEYMEAEIDGYGIDFPRQACQVAEGIAFQNSSGMFLFDGNQFQEPDNGFLSTLNWGNSGITYSPHRKLISCFIDLNGDGDLHAFHYSLRTKTWVGSSSSSVSINAPLTNSYVGSDGKSHYYGANEDAFGAVVAPNGIVNLGTINSTLGTYATLTTGKIHCGNIARRKKFKAVSVSCVTGGWKFKYKVDEGSWSSYYTLTDGLNRTKLTGESGYYIRLSFAPQSAGTDNAEIGDITVVYRDKTLK